MATNQEDELVCTIDLGRVTPARELGRVLDYRAPELYGAITQVPAMV